MRNLLLILIMLTAVAQVKAHEVASTEGTSTETIEYWILDEVN